MVRCPLPFRTHPGKLHRLSKIPVAKRYASTRIFLCADKKARFSDGSKSDPTMIASVGPDGGFSIDVSGAACCGGLGLDTP